APAIRSLSVGLRPSAEKACRARERRRGTGRGNRCGARHRRLYRRNDRSVCASDPRGPRIERTGHHQSLASVALLPNEPCWPVLVKRSWPHFASFACAFLGVAASVKDAGVRATNDIV